MATISRRVYRRCYGQVTEFSSLNPGTPLFAMATKGPGALTPLHCLRIIALVRFTNPDSDVLVAGGRDLHLRDLQSAVFWAGANAVMVGDYLTTRGRKVADDWQMFRDLEVELTSGCGT